MEFEETRNDSVNRERPITYAVEQITLISYPDLTCAYFHVSVTEGDLGTRLTSFSQS